MTVQAKGPLNQLAQQALARKGSRRDQELAPVLQLVQETLEEHPEKIKDPGAQFQEETKARLAELAKLPHRVQETWILGKGEGGHRGKQIGLVRALEEQLEDPRDPVELGVRLAEELFLNLQQVLPELRLSSTN